MQAKSRSSGFTLIELMIVVAVIGILAAIGIQTFQGNRAKAMDRAAAADVRNLMSAASASASK